MIEPTPHPPPPRRTVVSGEVIATLLTGLLLTILILAHAPYVVGPGFWAWAYRRLPAWPLYAMMLGAAVPLVAGQVIYRPRSAKRTAVALVLTMSSCFLMKLASVATFTQPPSLQVIPVIVQSRETTSYYTDAAGLNSEMTVREWLREYPALMPTLSLHSKTKAPGPILYYTAFIRMMGVSERTALVAGLMLGALATLSIPACYLLLKLLTRDEAAAMCGAVYLALCPGFVLFFPMFDPTYILLSTALVGQWAIAVERRSWLAALGLGVALTLTCMITFNVLVIGVFMALYPLFVAHGPLKERLTAALTRGMFALATAAVLLLVIQSVTGYDAAATFASAWRNQHRLLAIYGAQRPYPQTIPFDLVDFALGSGWMSVILVGCFFSRRRATGDANEARHVRLVALCVAQLLIVALTGLLQLETARVWNFMLPLLMVPVGLVMRQWDTRARLMVYAVTWLVLAAIAQNVGYIYIAPPPVPPGL